MAHKRKEIPIDDSRLLLTQQEAANTLGVGMTTIYWMLKEGKIAGRRLGRRVMIETAELRRFVDSMPAH